MRLSAESRPQESPVQPLRRVRRPAIAGRPPHWNRTSPSARDSHLQSSMKYQPIPAVIAPGMPPSDRDNAAPSLGDGTPVPPALPPAAAQAHAAQIPHAAPPVQFPPDHRRNEPIP